MDSPVQLFLNRQNKIKSKKISEFHGVISWLKSPIAFDMKSPIAFYKKIEFDIAFRKCFKKN